MTTYISIMNNDMGVVETNYFTAFFTIVQFAISMFVAVIALIWLNPLVALVAILLSLLPLSVPKLFGKMLANAQSQYVQLLGKLNEKIKDFFEGFEVIKTFGVEKNANEAFSEVVGKSERSKYRFNISSAYVNSFANMLSVGVQFAIFLISGLFVLRGNLTIVMRDGEIVEKGSFDELCDMRGYFYSLNTVTGR